jgi:hypothetical protein
MQLRTDPDRDAVRQWNRLKHSAKEARRPFDRDTWLNMAFYLDEQYVEWVDTTATLRRIPRSESAPNQPRPVANKMMYFAQQELAYVMASKPSVDILAANDDPVAVSNSIVTNAYCQWAADPNEADFPAELRDSAMWAIVGGEGYLKWYWDEAEKRPGVTSVNSLDLYVDPYAKNFYRARYMIHSQFMDVEQIYDIYGIELKPDEVQRSDVDRTALLRGMGAAPVLEGVEINELWMKASRRFPKGKFVVWAGNKIIVDQDFPYRHGLLPFTQIGAIDRPGSQHYASPLKYMRSAQMELNKYHAQRIMIREAFASPKWWIDSQLELEEDPNDSPRQVLRGNSHGGQLKPELLQPTTFADNNEGEWIGQEMMNIIGLHEVSQGQVPGRVEAAKAIEMLRQSDQSRQSTMLDTMERSISKGFYQWIMLAKQFAREQQIVTVYSRDGIPEVHQFKSDQVEPSMRVRVTMGSTLGVTRAARADNVINLVDHGILKDPEQIVDLLELPMQSITPDKAYDQRLARNENITMKSGDAIVPNSWDNHDVHIRIHNNFRKTTEFLGLSDKKKSLFEFHVDQHERMEADQLAKQAQRMQLMQQAATGPEAPPQGDGLPTATNGASPPKPPATQQRT